MRPHMTRGCCGLQDIPKVKDCFVRAKAVGVTDTAVQLSTGQSLPYDFLVFSFGTAYADNLIYSQSGTAADRRQQFKVGLKQCTLSRL